MINENGLEQHISSCTTDNGTLIDHLYTNLIEEDVQTGTVPLAYILTYDTRMIRVSNAYDTRIKPIHVSYTNRHYAYVYIRPHVCCHIYEHAFRTTGTNINGII